MSYAQLNSDNVAGVQYVATIDPTIDPSEVLE
jgi:hypothetical protein